MRHILLTKSHNVEIFSMTSADCGDLSLLLSLWWAKYKCLYLLFVLTILDFTYYGGLFLHGWPYNIERLFILAILRFAVFATVQSFLCVAKKSAL